MNPPFKLPPVSKRLEAWEVFEKKVTNLFKYGAGCPDAKKVKVGGFEVDCLASNENAIYVVECKTRDELSKTNQKLKDYLITFAGKKVSIGNALRTNEKQKDLVFILCFDEFEPTDVHKSLAKDNGIYLWDKVFIKNIENLYTAIGPRARQYMNYALGVEETIVDGNDHESLMIPALASETMIGGTRKQIYNLFLSAEHLLDLGYVYHITNGDPDAYQRMLKASRLKGIGEFIDEDNSFNSSVVVVFDQQVRFRPLNDQDKFQYTTGFLYIPKTKSSVRIIDGQHRIYAYQWADPQHLEDKIPVLGLQTLPAPDQAKIFLDINNHQSPVKKDDLNLIMARTDPGGTGFLPNIVLAANGKGTLKNKIRTPDTVSVHGSIGLANAVRGIADRKLFSPHNPLIHGRIEPVNRNVIEEAAEVLSHFYQTVVDVARKVDPRWIDGFIFTNTGFNILLFLLHEIGKYHDHYTKNWLSNEIELGLLDYFNDNLPRMEDIKQMTNEGGRRENARALIYEINKHDASFGAKFVKDFVPRKNRSVKTKGEYLEQASTIENRLKNLVEKRLKKISTWWVRCVPDATRERIDAEFNHDRQSYIEDSSPSRREDYLNFADMLVIIEKNWASFAPILGVKSSALHSIETVRQIRDKLARGKEIADLSDDEKEHFDRSIAQLERRMDS